MNEVTVVFADLTGSSQVFEAVGNAKATQAITQLTNWLGQVCVSRRGKVVKNLGDGVLMVFEQTTDAIEAVIDMNRLHVERTKSWPTNLQMLLKIGLARGGVIEQDGDFFGDAVNLASRLSDLSGPSQILSTDTVINQLADDSLVRYRSMGEIEIRGRSERCKVYRIEWQNEVLSDLFTQPCAGVVEPDRHASEQVGIIVLSCLDVEATFTSVEMPIHLGRVNAAQFVVNDPRVSRLHCQITWRAGNFYLEDVSSYGTWVRFSGGDSVVTLRREEFMLLTGGEIALSAPFEDFSVPTVRFTFSVKKI